MEPVVPVSVALALVVGAALKRVFLKDKPQVLRDAIPVFVFASQFLGRLALEAAPAEAGIFSFVGRLAPTLEQVALESLFYTVLAGGTQSTLKNAGKALGLNTLALLRQRVVVALGGQLPPPPAPPAVTQ
jgi:hypothetical protein